MFTPVTVATNLPDEILLICSISLPLPSVKTRLILTPDPTLSPSEKKPCITTSSTLEVAVNTPAPRTSPAERTIVASPVLLVNAVPDIGSSKPKVEVNVITSSLKALPSAVSK